MKLRRLLLQDRPRLVRLIQGIGEFSEAEKACAVELVDVAVANPEQRDYEFVIADDPDDPGGGPLGYACFGPTPMTDATYDLYWIAVAERARGLGLGRALVAAVEEELATVRVARHLLVETGSAPVFAATRAFYEANGYTVAARIPDFYKIDDDLIIYRKVFKRHEDPRHL